jgi:hypothetical protein
MTAIYVEMTEMVCGKCGTPFAMPTSFYNECRKDSRVSFFCPHGHERIYGDGQIQRLTKELAAKDQELAAKREEAERQRKRAEREERRVAAQKGINTRLKNKIASGTCPCCDKLFPDLSSHMATEHPDFEGAADPEEKQE